MKERWIPIHDVPGYEVSSLGRIRRLAGLRTCRSKFGLAFTRPTKAKIHVTKAVSTSGYLRIGIGEDRKTRYVHRIVAAAFHPNPKRLREVNHKNGNKMDNRADNLEWVNPKENHAHAWATGLKRRGPRPASRKYTVEQVDEMKRQYCEKMLSTCVIAEQFSTANAVIAQILRREGVRMRSRHWRLKKGFDSGTATRTE